MKKKLSICAAALIALAMTACDNGKTGTIEGEVRDAFTDKPLEMPTVGMDSTIYTTLSKKYEFNQELRKGKFKFVKVPVGTYRVYAGRSKYVKTRMKIETTEQNPNASLILYIYSAQVDPVCTRVLRKARSRSITSGLSILRTATNLSLVTA